MRYYLSHWKWVEPADDIPHWRHPSDYPVAGIDLRSLPQQSTPITPDGKGFFATSQPDSNLDLLLGDRLDGAVSSTLRRKVESVLGLNSGDLSASTIIELIAELLTYYGDPTGIDRWKPLLSDTIWLPGHSPVWSGSWRSDPVWREKWLQVRQEDYRRIRQECLDGLAPQEHYRKVLDYWSKKYNLDPDLLIPKGLPKETPLPHATTIGDTFVETSSTVALSSHTATGPNGGFSWSEVENGILVREITDDAYSNTNNQWCTGRADSDLSGDDHYSEANCTDQGSGVKVVAVLTRFASAATTFYRYGSWGAASGENRLQKVVAGSVTLINDYNDTPGRATGELFHLESDGSTHTPTRAGSPLTGQTDTSITGNVRCGFAGYSLGNTFDNFEAADLAVGGGIPKAVAVYHQRHHNRAM